jgi:hypothetical protein
MMPRAEFLLVYHMTQRFGTRSWGRSLGLRDKEPQVFASSLRPLALIHPSAWKRNSAKFI